MKSRLFFLVAVLASPRVFASTLHLTIDDLRSDHGHVLVAVYRNAEGFPGKPEDAVYTESVPAKSGTLDIDVPGLKPGEYAVALHHDENNDNKMNYSFIGIPKEGFGFSNNKKIFFGPPSFRKAKVQIGAIPINIDIKMKYF